LSLGSVSVVINALSHCLGLHRHSIRTRLLLCQRIAADFFTTRVGMEELLLLFSGTETVNWITVEGILHGEDYTGGCAAARNLFDTDRVSVVIEAIASLQCTQSKHGHYEY